MQSDAKAARAKVVVINANGKGSTPLSAGDRAKLARLPAPVHSVQEKGKQQFSKALRNLFDSADDALFELADRATNNQEQNLYFESMREVRIRRRELESRFADAIDNAFLSLVIKNARYESDATESLSPDSLSLVGNDELEELVAVDSMIARANNNCGESLQYLSLRLDSLVPNKVYQKSNPLGPEVICNGFVSATRNLDADIKAKLVLFKLFEQHVLSELPRIYEDLNATLIEHNVLPSLKHQKPAPRHATGSQDTGTPSRPGQADAGVYPGAGGQARGGGAAGYMGVREGQAVYSTASEAAANQLMTALTLIQGQQWSTPSGTAVPATSGPASQQAAPTAASSPVASAQTSSQPITPPAAGPDTPAAPTDVKGLLLQVLHEQHGQGELEQSQLETINLVKLLFEFILDDRNLAEPMKLLIGRLQIPILKVALLDKTFFNKRGHPARRLLNEMATASLGWQETPGQEISGQEGPGEEGAIKDPLYRKISATVERLLHEFETDLSLFNDVLADFVSFIDKERKRASLLEQRTIDAEDGKARAEAARQQVNDAVACIIADNTVPAEVREILEDAWSNVLFLICLKQGVDSDEWQQALQTAEDLVWSVTVDIGSESRPQLLGMIPHLVKRLRDGLERIAYNPFEMTKLLTRLEKLHLARLQSVGPASVGPASVGDRTPQAGGGDADSGRTHGGRTRGNSIHGSSTHGGSPDSNTSGSRNTSRPATDDGAPAEAGGAAVTHDSLAIVDSLTQGTWFEMTESNGKSVRCRLAAIIKPGGKYIFVNRSGMKVAEKTRESLALAMQESHLRLLDDTMLFDRALQSVIGSLRKPS